MRADEEAHAQMTGAQLLFRWPEAARTFFRHRMACVGCTTAEVDALAEVAAAPCLDLAFLMAEQERDGVYGDEHEARATGRRPPRRATVRRLERRQP